MGYVAKVVLKRDEHPVLVFDIPQPLRAGDEFELPGGVVTIVEPAEHSGKTGRVEIRLGDPTSRAIIEFTSPAPVLPLGPFTTLSPRRL